jgi:predicted Zn finger-like uncharacterized protein
MALATKCPQCGAMFRVVADQLKLRGGLVRCGQCRTVFDAIGSLAYVEESALNPARPDDTAAASPAAAPPAMPQAASTTEAPKARSRRDDGPKEDSAELRRKVLGPATTLRISPGAAPVATVSLPLPPPPAPRDRGKRAPAFDEQALSVGGVPTLMAGGGAAAAIEVPAIADPAHEGIADEEPQFLRQPRPARRGFSIIFGGGTLLLALVAAAQLAVIFRSEVLKQWPAARPALTAFCDVLRCNVGWPTQPDQLAVINSELQALAGTDVLELTAVVRNRAGFTQALPALEVTLSDTQNRPVARKVFTPADYLEASGEPARRIDEGIAAGSDLSIRLYIETRGLQPAGFLVYPFHI